MALGHEVDEIFRREVKSLPAYEKAQAAGGSEVAPPVEEMNLLLIGLVVAVQRSFHLCRRGPTLASVMKADLAFGSPPGPYPPIFQRIKRRALKDTLLKTIH